MSAVMHPEDRWEPRDTYCEVSSNGPERIYDDNPTPSLVRPVGFVQAPCLPEPLLWEGDDA